jgi:GT2 family glycosyltransferase
MELSIIIVNYNTKDFLRDCLVSVQKTVSTSLKYEVIVVDNDSTDESAEMVKKEFPNVSLVENENEGFAKANNRGVKKSKGEYVLFLNPDTVVHEKTIEGMLAFMGEHQDAGAVTCKLVMKNGQIDYASHRGFPTPWNSFCYFSGISKHFPKVKFLSGYTGSWQNFDTVHEIDALAGAFMLVQRKAGEEVGWWDEDYFFNGEDLDFCFRLKEKGWKIYYVPQYSILHYNGVSGGTKKTSSEISTATKETKRRIQKARFDAMRIFYKKHYRDKYPGFVTGLVLVGINMKQKATMKQNGL